MNLQEEGLVQRNVVERFIALIKAGRLAHAYLFWGPKHTGKQATASYVARLLNCEGNAEGWLDAPCGTCGHCLKLLSGAHPDFYFIESLELERSIKIAQTRELITRLHMRAFEARYKVVVIKNSEELTLEAGNSLLKTLEEPSKDSLIFLTASAPEKILSTIRSRCHAVQFFPFAPAEIKGRLQNEYRLNDQRAHFLGFFSEGSFGKARPLAQEEFFRWKNQVIDEFVYSPDSEGFIKELVKDKAATKIALEVLLSWFRDALLLKRGLPEDYLANADRLAELRQHYLTLSFERIEQIIKGVIDTTWLLDENFNVKIPLALVREKIWAK